MENVFIGDCWSSNEFESYSYKLTITSEVAKTLVQAMDIAQRLSTSSPNLDLLGLELWVTGCEIVSNDEPVIVDVQIARVRPNYVIWHCKNKYTADVYETDDIGRERLMAIAEGRETD